MPGISNTKTGLFAAAAPELANLSKIPSQAIFVTPQDANANSFIGDVYFTQQRNLTSHVTTFPGFSFPGADVFYSQFATNVAGLAQATGWIYVSSGTLANQVTGPRLGNIKSFSARVVPKHPSLAPVNCSPGFFCGIAKNTGNASALNTSLALPSNGANTDTSWRTRSDGIGYIGFYYLKATSLNWLLAVGDGAGNATLIDTGVPVDTTNTALLQFLYNGNTLRFFINGTFITSITTTLPSNNMGMCIFIGMAMMTATSATTQLIWGLANIFCTWL